MSARKIVIGAVLVISLHALALGPAAQMETSQWNKVADEHGFVVVYPLGTGVAPIWLLRPEANLAANVRFIIEATGLMWAFFREHRLPRHHRER